MSIWVAEHESNPLTCHFRDSKKYAGPYVYNQASGTWHGCPARSDVIYDTLKAIKNKHTAEGAKCRQAEVMTLDDLSRLIQWSEIQCPPRLLTDLPARSHSAYKLGLDHGLMRAFMSTGFTLWTR